VDPAAHEPIRCNEVREFMSDPKEETAKSEAPEESALSGQNEDPEVLAHVQPADWCAIYSCATLKP